MGGRKITSLAFQSGLAPIIVELNQMEE